MSNILELRGLSVEFPTRHGTLKALNDVSFSIAAGEVLGVVGESGAGKSLTGAAIIGLLEPEIAVFAGKIERVLFVFSSVLDDLNASFVC